MDIIINHINDQPNNLTASIPTMQHLTMLSITLDRQSVLAYDSNVIPLLVPLDLDVASKWRDEELGSSHCASFVRHLRPRG